LAGLPTPYLVDYHVHSTLSGDAISTPQEILEAALSRGLAEVVFTEHLEFIPPPDYDEPAYVPERVLAAGDYLAAIRELRKRAGSRIRIGMGVELGLERHNLDSLTSYLEENDLPLDYILGSVHSLKGVLVQTPEFTDPLGPAEAARLYFGELLGGVRRAVRLGACDVVGHLDLVKRSPTFGPFRLEDHREAVESLLREIVDAGLGVEVNTSGWRQAPGEPYPGPDVLKLYRKLGGEIVTIGSDSHSAETVGLEAGPALDYLREAGFHHLTVFDRRRPTFRPI